MLVMLQTSVYLLVAMLAWPQSPCQAGRLPVAEDDTRTVKYTVLIDAGSSGSKLKTFKMFVSGDGKLKERKDIQSLQHGLDKVKPGLSSFSSDQSGVEDYLKKLIDGAKAVIPVNQQASTPILLMATADLRLLSDDEKLKILTETRRVFHDKNLCPFDFKDENAQVITGTEEAIYDWITVNFLKGVFFNPGTQVTTYGSLDLGGASTQVAFNPFSRNDSERITIGGKHYNLYANSYLGYGSKEVRNRFTKYLRESGEKDSDGNTLSPCHHDGFRESWQIDFQVMQVVGTADVPKCAKILDDLFFCGNATKPCIFNRQPSLNNRSEMFYAFATFNAILERIGALSNSSLVTVGSIGAAGNNFCNKKYDDVKADKYAKHNCAMAVFIHELFTKGYGMKADYEITVVQKLNGFKVNWILGSMLYKLNLL